METLHIRWWVGLMVLVTILILACVAIPALAQWVERLWIWLLFFT